MLGYGLQKCTCRSSWSLVALLLLFFSIAHADWQTEELSEAPKIIFVHDFLSDDECDHLITLATPFLERSVVVDASGSGELAIHPGRTSQGMFIQGYLRDVVVQEVEARLSHLTGLPQENAEAIQVLFYDVGGEYRPHYDYFDPYAPGGQSNLQQGGQRVATVIMYLNTPLQGGETIFPVAGVSVTPQKGTAVIFYNCLPSGKEDPLTLHGGAPVIEGQKWIATRWFRQGKFE